MNLTGAIVGGSVLVAVLSAGVVVVVRFIRRAVEAATGTTWSIGGGRRG